MNDLHIRLLSAAGYLVLAPFLGGLLSGLDRKLTARMQGRQGPPLLQAFYDVAKLFKKQPVVVNSVQNLLIVGFLVFVAFTGCLFFYGGDLLLIFFALSLAVIFIIMSASSANSPYSSMGAQRELVQMLAYEPMVLLTAVGFYLFTGSFAVSDIIRSEMPAIAAMPGVFLGFLFILIIKFEKSPFDLSTSHHAHQEMVKGLNTEHAGNILGLIEIAHWYETIFLLCVTGLFFITTDWYSWLIALAVVLLVYFAAVLVDNTFPRVKWQSMVVMTWGVTLILGVLNLLILSLLNH